MPQTKTINITLTKEESKALITQIGARIDDLKLQQKEAGRKENIDRVLEIEEFIKPIKSGYQKLMDAHCNC